MTILTSGSVAGTDDIYTAIPRIVGTPKVLVGYEYLILYAYLESEGNIYACAVEDNDLNNAI